MTTLSEFLYAEPVARFKWNLDALVDLLLRPERFFGVLLNSRFQEFPFLAIWIWGVAGAMDQIDTRLMLKEMTIGTSGLAEIASSWPRLWITIVVVGLIRGPFAWLIGGWWYRMRLRFSGAKDVHPRHARYVYLYSNLVYGVPLLIVLALDTGFYPNYKSAALGGAFWLSLLATALWSIFVSYRAAIGCFGVRRNPARIWFLILPIVILGGIALAITSIGLFAAL